MSKIEYNNAKRLPNKIYEGASVENGKSYVYIDCPFCGTQVKAYNWSLAGGGKKCPTCGALHTWSNSYPLKKPLNVDNE